MVSDNQLVPTLTVRQVAQLLHIHSNTVRRWSDREIISPYRVTRRGDPRFRQKDIARLLLALNGNGRKQKKLA